MPTQTPSSPMSIRGLHLDLKGVPPTIDRLVRLLTIASTAGYNAVLVEWEDSLPWKVDERFRSPEAYTPQDVARFYAEARRLGIEVIPLVQCLGHMETPLNVPDYFKLRQFPHLANVLDPLAPGARDLVERMVDDALSHAPKPPRWFHLGGDEAWGFGTTESAKKFIAAHGGKGALYLHHVEPILDRLLARGIRPILWHDMMATWEPEALKRISTKADLMAWGYGEHPDVTKHHYRREVLERLRDHGVPMWGACAYKGGEGESNDVPNFPRRCANALSWVDVGRRYGFQGVVATAWSRYTTHRVQCEPIDGALDALVAVGMILRDGASPPDIREKALHVLDQLGERARFQACYDSLSTLQSERNGAWTSMKELYEAVAMERRDARRRGGIASDCLYHAARWNAGPHRTAQKVRDALHGLLSPETIEAYLAERLEPLKQQIDAITPIVAELEPTTWPAIKAELQRQGIETA